MERILATAVQRHTLAPTPSPPVKSSALSQLFARTIGALILAATLRAQSTVDVYIDLMPGPGNSHQISPYIYGSNAALPGVTFPLLRQGGNRHTGYNWENNASNAGHDYHHQSDNYLTWVAGLSDAQANTTPGLVVTHFHDAALAAGTGYSIVTLPMAGFVAADKLGPVTPAQAAPSSRWLPVEHRKPTAFSLSPDLTDGKVYTDELLNFIVSRYGAASTVTGIKAYSLDNEPDLWSEGRTLNGAVALDNNGTHPLLHPADPRATELITRSVDLAKTIKRMDATAEVVGFASYGFKGHLDFQEAPDWPTERTKGNYRWFLDYYLDQMRQASDAAGQRLLDVLDLHNYTEAKGGGIRVNETTDYANTAANAARMQAPRTWWDSTYVEDSWLGEWQRDFLPLLPNFRRSIDAFYPGTKLAILEYGFGAEDHISGGIAQADALGILGRQNVYAAARWPLGENDRRYAIAAFKLFLDYDGQGGRFGNWSVNAYTLVNGAHDRSAASVYAAGGDGGRLHVIVLNKRDATTEFRLHVLEASYSKARVFAFDATSATITERTPVPSFPNNTLTYSLPAFAAAHFVLDQLSGPTITTQPPATQALAVGQTLSLSVAATGEELRYQWQRDDADIPGATSATLTLANASVSDTGSYRCVVSNAGLMVLSSICSVTVTAAPFTLQPRSVTINHTSAVTLTSAATGALSYQWQRDGRALAGAANASLTFPKLQPADSGIYSVAVTTGFGTATSDWAVVGLNSWDKVTGAGEEVGPNIVHPNGKTYDQFLLKGAAASITTDEAQVARVSFIDLDDDIVQVEFSGPGTLSLVLDGASGPALPRNYNQEVSYMKGHAGIVVSGATQASHLSVFSVGKANAVNQALFKSDVTYDGVADIAYIAILSANGRFGGLYAGNTHCFAERGLTGIYAPNVAFSGPVRIGDITAFESATPVFVLGGANAELPLPVLVAGGDFQQANSRPVQVRQRGFAGGLWFGAGTDSHGNRLDAQTNRGVLKDNEQDVSDLARTGLGL